MRTGIGSVSRMSQISRRTWVNAAEKPSKRPSDGKVGGVDGVTTGVRGGELSDDMVRSVAVGVTNFGVTSKVSTTSEGPESATWANSVDQQGGAERSSRTDDGASENDSGASRATANLK